MRALALAALVFVTPVWASEPELAPFRACTAIADNVARLACFDAAAAGIDARRAAEAATEKAALEAKAAAAKVQAADDFGKPRYEQTSNTPADGDSDLIRARVVSFSRDGFGKIVVVLDNGHVWKEIDGSTFRGRLKDGEEVEVRKRPLGGYALAGRSSPRPAHVRRIR